MSVYPNPILGTNTIVNIRRRVKAFPDQHPNDWGPMSIADAAEHIGTSGGTVSVEITVAEGEHAGAHVYTAEGKWFAQYDPILQFPNGSDRV